MLTFFISSNCFALDSLGFSVYTIMTSDTCKYQISFSCLIGWSGTSSMRFYRSSESGHSCLVHDRRNAFHCWGWYQLWLCRCTQLISPVWLFVTLWTAACQTPLSMGFFRQEYWSGLPFTPPRDLPDSGIEPASPESLTSQTDSLPTEPSGKSP